MAYISDVVKNNLKGKKPKHASKRNNFFITIMTNKHNQTKFSPGVKRRDYLILFVHFFTQFLKYCCIL